VTAFKEQALVAQLDRVLGYEPSGRRFESFRVHHIKNPSFSAWVFLWLGVEGENLSVRPIATQLGPANGRPQGKSRLSAGLGQSLLALYKKIPTPSAVLVNPSECTILKTQAFWLRVFMLKSGVKEQPFGGTVYTPLQVAIYNLTLEQGRDYCNF
jgi:hypothetical protein